MKKYELTDEYVRCNGRKLFRIRALISFADVTVGDLGGFIEKEENLSHKGFAWVYNDAKVYNNARVYDDAHVGGYSEVYDNAQVYDDAYVYGNAAVYNNAQISGNAQVYASANVYNNARVYDNANVCGYSVVFDNARISGNAVVLDGAQVCDNAQVYDNAFIYDSTCINGNAEICGDARVCRYADYISIQGLGGEFKNITTVCLDRIKGISVKCGCFLGSLQEFETMIKETHGDNKFAKEYLKLIELIKIHFDVPVETERK